MTMRSSATESVLRYTIRANNLYDYRTTERLANNYLGSTMLENTYIDSGFTNLQMAIDRFLIALRYGNNTIPVYTQLAEKPTRNGSDEMRYNFNVFGMFIVVLYTSLFLPGTLMDTLIEEKVNGVRDLLRNSTPFYQYNLITLHMLHFAIGFVYFAITILMVSLMNVTRNLTWTCTIILIVLYLPSAIMFVFLLSIPFQSTFHTNTAAPVIIIAVWVSQWIDFFQFLTPWISSILMTKAFAFFDDFAARDISFGIDNIFEPNDSFKNYSMFHLWMLILIDTVIYALLYSYLVQVFPGKYGTAEPLAFPWIRLRKLLQRSDRDAQRIERTSIRPDTVISIRGLFKEYATFWGFWKMKRILDDVNMDICAKQINILLGHNGAGKTTLMSIVCGAQSKTSGEISVNGETDVNMYRHMIGYCPQHNTFLPFMTCMDNFVFIGRVS